MKYRSICPSCSKPQTRWDCFEPFIGFVNTCRHCKADYKSGGLSILFGTTIGIIVLALLILSDEGIFHWALSIPLITLAILISIYISPFVIKLKPVEGLKDDDEGWLKPFLKWQVLLTFVIIILVVFQLVHINILSTIYSTGPDVVYIIENMNTVENLKTFAKAENSLRMSGAEYSNNFAKLTLTFLFLMGIPVMSNILFYMKIRSKKNTKDI